MTQPITPLIDPRCTALGITVEPPQDTTRPHWELSHLWLTDGGNWDNVPEWAKQFQNDHLGGDRHVYFMGLRFKDSYRSAADDPDIFILGWPDGYTKLSPKEEHQWWANDPINAGFDWQKVSGPYYGMVNSVSTSKVHGLGLPYPPYPWEKVGVVVANRRHYWDGKTYVGKITAEMLEAVPKETRVMGGMHTSFFLVFQEVEAYEQAPPDPPAPSGQLQRVLDKAEACADCLYEVGDGSAAGDLYMLIADFLTKCQNVQGTTELTSTATCCAGEDKCGTPD